MKNFMYLRECFRYQQPMLVGRYEKFHVFARVVGTVFQTVAIL